MTSRTLTLAYIEGKKAYKEHQDGNSNPYPAGTFKHSEWNEGWLDACNSQMESYEQ